MNEYYICCDECFDTVARRNTTAAMLWMDLCKISSRQGEVLYLEVQDFSELRTLEKLGFIVSTEMNNFLAVKVKGKHLAEDGEDLFCPTGTHG